jgi:cholesterol transport system auxiliary component
MKTPPAVPLRARRSMFLATGIAFAFAAVLTGCTLTRPSPVKRTYLFDPTAPPAASAPKPYTLRVAALRVAAPYAARQLVYRYDELKYEADFYSEFFVAPAAMLSEAIARTLAAANVFKRVIPPGASPEDGVFLLDGFVNELYGDAREPKAPAAVLSVTFYLSVLNPLSEPSVIWSREYRQRVPVAASNPDEVVRAWNTALTALVGELSRDLAAMNLPEPK